MQLLPLIGFALVTTVTPGPNNIMVAAAVARHGMAATWPHMLGIAVGFAVMLMAVGAGLGAILNSAPAAAQAARWCGLAWLCWLAWKIASAGAPGEGAARPPLGFWGAAAFQWINPKAWLMSLGAASAFIRPDAGLWHQVLMVAAVFLAVTPLGMLPWAALGVGAARLLQRPGRARAFNVTMAVLLVASMLPVALEG